jgi:CelD/BcsL family acetyltransferase involved in cellulose biosynthesis
VAAGTSAPAVALRIEVVTTASGFEALRSGWNALVDAAARASVFTTWEWQSLWWKHYGAGRPLRVLVAWEGDRIVGILPLYLRSGRLLRWIPIRVLQPIGTGGDTSPDYLEPPLAAARAAETAAALIRHAVDHVGGWDQLVLSDLDPASEFGGALERLGRERGVMTRSGVSARIRYIALGSTWDEYLGSLNTSRRQEMRRLRRRFEETPGARFRMIGEQGPALDAAIDRLAELHRMRWADRDRRHAFSSGEYCGFHRELMHELQQDGRLRLVALEIEGRVVAMLYCYRFRDSWLYFQAGFDPAHSKLRPGFVLLGYAIEQAIAEGCREFDMLRGEHEYKAQLAKLTRETVEIRALRPGMKATAQSLRERLAAFRKPGSGGECHENAAGLTARAAS